MSLNKVRFTVCGSPYVVSTAEEESYVLELADRMDRDMENILSSTPSASVTTAAVISALDYLDQMQKIGRSAEKMHNQIKDYLEDAAQARLAVEALRKENEQLRREVQELKEQNSRG